MQANLSLLVQQYVDNPAVLKALMDINASIEHTLNLYSPESSQENENKEVSIADLSPLIFLCTSFSRQFVVASVDERFVQ